MVQHNVDFLGGDFNMRAFSTVGDVFADLEFSAPGNSLLWGLGALEDSNPECTGFLVTPKRPHEWYVDAHGCYKFNNADLALGRRDTTAHFLVFLHLRTTNFPCPDSTMWPKTNPNDFGWVLEFFSRFEFDCRRRVFLKESNFWCVQSSTACNETVHVHVLSPVCTQTIPFRMLRCP